MQFTWGLEIGGQERVVVDLAKAFHNLGFRSAVATTLLKGELTEELESHEIPFHCFASHKSYNLSLLLNVVSYLQEFQPDVVITHGVSGSIVPKLAAIFLRVPVFLHVEHTLTPRFTFAAYINQWIYRCADRIICVSSAVRDSFLSRYRINPEKTSVIHNGVDACRFSPAVKNEKDQRKTVTIIANFENAKGHIYFLTAAAIVCRVFPQVQFLLVGEGRLQESLQQFVAAQNLADHCQFLGKRTDIESILNRSDIFVLSSLTEGLPLSLLEAQYFGVATIATRVGGISEVVAHGINGLLVPPRNANALATAMLMLLRDDALRHTLGCNAEARIPSTFSISVTASKYVEQIRQVLANKRSPNPRHNALTKTVAV